MKKIKIEIEVAHEIGETVYFMSFKGLPRKAAVIGYDIYTPDSHIEYFVKNSNGKTVSYPFKSNELFKTYEEMLKKRKLISPAEAKRLLVQIEKKVPDYILKEDIKVLEERAKLSKLK